MHVCALHLTARCRYHGVGERQDGRQGIKHLGVGVGMGVGWGHSKDKGLRLTIQLAASGSLICNACKWSLVKQ